jgi:hypothetical protein
MHQNAYLLSHWCYIHIIYIKYKNDMLHIIIYRLMNKITYRNCKIPKTTCKHIPHRHRHTHTYADKQIVYS